MRSAQPERPTDVGNGGAVMSIGLDAVADTAVRTEDLRRFFEDTRAVDGVDLDVKTGEIYGFLGPNGAGKSTLVHVLCTLLLPTSGRAEVAGFDVARQPVDVRLRIGVALQEASLDPAQTGIELLRLQGRLYGLTKTETEQRLRELAHRVGIINEGHLIKEGTPTDLKRSLGSDVIIARVEDGAERACNAVREVAGVDQVDVHGDELTVRALDGSAVLSPVAIALDGCGVRVRDLTLREPTLDDVFLELTGGHIHQRDGQVQQEGTSDNGDA